MAQVLIIEDDPGARYMLVRAFIAAGYAVSEASDGANGIRLFDAEKPELVVADLMMTGIDGIEFINMLRTRNAEAFIIAVSGQSGAQNLQAAKLMGANAFFSKPVNPFTIVEAANGLFSQDATVPSLRPERRSSDSLGRRAVPRMSKI